MGMVGSVGSVMAVSFIVLCIVRVCVVVCIGIGDIKCCVENFGVVRRRVAGVGQSTSRMRAGTARASSIEAIHRIADVIDLKQLRLPVVLNIHRQGFQHSMQHWD